MTCSGKKKITFYTLFIGFLLYSNTYTKETPLMDQKELFRILNQFKKNTPETVIADKFDTYLKQVSSLNNEQYLTVLQKSFNRYYKAIADFGACSDNAKELKKKYSSDWIVDFHKRFDRKSISSNLDSIKNHIFELGLKQDSGYCEENMKECFYVEAYCIRSLQGYIRHYIDFTNTLNEAEKETVRKRKAAAELFLETLIFPIQEMHTIGNIRISSSSLGILSTDIPPEMKVFFSQHPLFSMPFKYGKAIDDLMRYNQ